MMKRRSFSRRTVALSAAVFMTTCLLALADFCTQCGVKLPGGAKFCPKCGSKVTTAADTHTPVRTRTPPPPPPPEEVDVPVEAEPTALATIPIRRTYQMKKDARGQWQIELGSEMDVKEATFVDLKSKFEDLMWGKSIEGHHLEYFFEKFLILEQEGALKFAYDAIRVYEKSGARRMQSKPGTGDTASWHNDVSGQVYELKIKDRTITINEAGKDS